ncbi:YesK family protein [Virgibacillus halophilus]|uniref:YesK family protein n=1 Tax=Tigheibacillus halophilus TaxID=361280 RepID=A0ABU5C7T8_9BACI|nr:YesK family protein [Virgibacillus halophilus]
MFSLVVLTVIFIIVIALISLIYKNIEKKIFLSLAFVFISVVLFFISFIVGGWEGLGLGAVCISLFAASFIA